MSQFFLSCKHFRQDSALSSASLNSSLISDPGGLAADLSPYRKYLEKYLKSKGIKKTMQGIHRLTRGLLHRARVALEQPEPILDSEYLSASGHLIKQTKRCFQMRKHL